MPLTGLATALAKRGQDLERVAPQDVDERVLAVRDVEIRLLWIGGQRHVPHGPRIHGFGLDQFLLHEFPVLRKYLQTIALAVADIHQIVLGDHNAVNGIAKLLLWWCVRIMRSAAIGRLRGVGSAAVRVERAHNGSIVRFVAIRAPDAFELAGIGVHHNNSVIDGSVRHVRLVRLRIDHDLCWLPEALHVEAIGVIDSGAVTPRTKARAILPDLHDELAIRGVFQDLRIGTAASSEPHVVLLVDVDAMLLVHPRIARSGSPVSEQIARLVELEDSWRGRTADLAEGRFHLQALDRVLVVPPMNHPDVILSVDPNAYRGPEIPMIR